MSLFTITSLREPNKYWIPPLLATAAYLAPYFMSKVFKADNWFKKDPDFKQFVFVDAKDNLPLTLFILSLATVKDKSYRDPLFLLFSTIVLCRTFTKVRETNRQLFLFIARKIPQDHIAKLACEKFAALTQPNQTS